MQRRNIPCVPTAEARGQANLTFGTFKKRSLPTKILIDKTGMIIGRYGGISGEDETELDNNLKKIFD